jgi:hypothetical protein
MSPGSFDGRYETWISRVHPDDCEFVPRAVREAVATRTTYGVTFRIICDDGTVLHLTTQGHAVYDANGAPIQILGGDAPCGDVVVRRRRT